MAYHYDRSNSLYLFTLFLRFLCILIDKKIIFLNMNYQEYRFCNIAFDKNCIIRKNIVYG